MRVFVIVAALAFLACTKQYATLGALPHRAEPLDCGVAPRTCTPLPDGGPEGACTVDADCDGGSCVASSDICSCGAASCTKDSECSPGFACACEGFGVAGRDECIEADCAIDTDCAAESCVLAPISGACDCGQGGALRFVCTSTLDTCRGDRDCANNEICGFDVARGFLTCGPRGRICD